jgi:hypothetical protein
MKLFAAGIFGEERSAGTCGACGSQRDQKPGPFQALIFMKCRFHRLFSGGMD